MNKVTLIKAGFSATGSFCAMYNCTVDRKEIPTEFFNSDGTGETRPMAAGTAKFLQLLGKSSVNDSYTKTVVYNEKNKETFEQFLNLIVGDKASEVMSEVNKMTPKMGDTSFADFNLEGASEFGMAVVRTTTPSKYENDLVMNPSTNKPVTYKSLPIYEDVNFAYGENSFEFTSEYVWSGQEVAEKV